MILLLGDPQRAHSGGVADSDNEALHYSQVPKVEQVLSLLNTAE